MKTKIRKISLFLLVAATMTTLSIAQPGQGRCMGPGQGPGYQTLRGQNFENCILDLSDDQKAELKTLRTEHFKVMKDFRNQMGEINAKQKTIMSANPIDKKAAEKLIDQKTELMNKEMKARVAHRAAMKEVLSEDQVLAWEQMQANRKFNRKNAYAGQRYAGQCPRGNFGPRNGRGQFRNM